MYYLLSVLALWITSQYIGVASAYVDLDQLHNVFYSDKKMETQFDDEVVRYNKHDLRSIDPRCTFWRYKRSKCKCTRKVIIITNAAFLNQN